ncbi:TetR/AcrR family transcriptional regulator [Nitrospirillum amazonense]|uniref:TetR family transcriptional regulator n=1 Tax=Nitrospirillum amazonense TaxID=28077 RepID=A0A560KAE9_9PROT|nr:TetR/AcrR family transcriptional regulator [Nitrospirillum amazonense]MDG3441220.1 TetR family transcriptional regulator C-terminal domain-containing protein [Nitrospirillum amazonense]TWB80291.1 TetR family transcriptional regulator [Nitrospirillum amazonense]
MNSGPSARRGPKPKPDTRDNLIRAGLQAIHADGFAATGIQGIVERADVPKGSFYNHFASKEAFGAEVLDAYSDLGLERLRAFLANSDLPPLARLGAYFDDRIKAFTAGGYARGCLLGNFSAEAADHSPLIREHLVQHWDAWTKALEGCLAEAQGQGAIDGRLAPASLARFILNSWEGALLRMRVEKTGSALIECKSMILETLLPSRRPS